MIEAAARPSRPSPERQPTLLERVRDKLLYVEDDDDLRDMIAHTFVEAGFDVTAVPSAERALEKLAATHYDVVVTDFNLTGETGGWLLEKATAKGYLQGTAAIMLTSERHPPGVSGFMMLRKPIDFGVLLGAIGDAVGHVIPRTAVLTVGAPPPAELELVLYVTSSSQDSQKAIRNLNRALKPFDPRRIRLTVVDVANGGDDAWYQGLEDDRVIVTPTLVRRSPGPKTWIVGTFAPIESLESLVASALGPPDPSTPSPIDSRPM